MTCSRFFRGQSKDPTLERGTGGTGAQGGALRHQASPMPSLAPIRQHFDACMEHDTGLGGIGLG